MSLSCESIGSSVREISEPVDVAELELDAEIGCVMSTLNVRVEGHERRFGQPLSSRHVRNAEADYRTRSSKYKRPSDARNSGRPAPSVLRVLVFATQENAISRNDDIWNRIDLADSVRGIQRRLGHWRRIGDFKHDWLDRICSRCNSGQFAAWFDSSRRKQLTEQSRVGQRD